MSEKRTRWDGGAMSRHAVARGAVRAERRRRGHASAAARAAAAGRAARVAGPRRATGSGDDSLRRMRGRGAARAPRLAARRQLLRAADVLGGPEPGARGPPALRRLLLHLRPLDGGPAAAIDQSDAHVRVHARHDGEHAEQEHLAGPGRGALAIRAQMPGERSVSVGVERSPRACFQGMDTRGSCVRF